VTLITFDVPGRIAFQMSTPVAVALGRVETKKGPSAPAAAPAEPPHDAAPGASLQSTQPSDTKEQSHV
jgi:hypothetical protein